MPAWPAGRRRRGGACYRGLRMSPPRRNFQEETTSPSPQQVDDLWAFFRRRLVSHSDVAGFRCNGDHHLSPERKDKRLRAWHRRRVASAPCVVCCHVTSSASHCRQLPTCRQVDIETDESECQTTGRGDIAHSSPLKVRNSRATKASSGGRVQLLTFNNGQR